MKRFPITAALVATIVLLLVSTANLSAAEPTLHELQSLEDLTATFNQGAGVPRVVLLLSPT